MAQDASSDTNEKSSSFIGRAGWFLFAIGLGALGMLLLFPNVLSLFVVAAGAALLFGAAVALYQAFKPDNENQSSSQSRNTTQERTRGQAQEPAQQRRQEPDPDEKDIEKKLDPEWGPPNMRLPLPPVKIPEPIPSPQQLPATAVTDTSASQEAATPNNNVSK